MMQKKISVESSAHVEIHVSTFVQTAKCISGWCLCCVRAHSMLIVSPLWMTFPLKWRHVRGRGRSLLCLRDFSQHSVPHKRATGIRKNVFFLLTLVDRSTRQRFQTQTANECGLTGFLKLLSISQKAGNTISHLLGIHSLYYTLSTLAADDGDIFQQKKNKVEHSTLTPTTPVDVNASQRERKNSFNRKLVSFLTDE